MVTVLLDFNNVIYVCGTPWDHSFEQTHTVNNMERKISGRERSSLYEDSKITPNIYFFLIFTLLKESKKSQKGNVTSFINDLETFWMRDSSLC